MMNSKLDRELAKVLENLDPGDRELVLEYARSLQGREHGRSQASLRDLVGTISREDREVMRETVEEIRGVERQASTP
jgi:hypothetical protein